MRTGMKIKYSARSHVGWVRQNNEDNLLVDGVTLPPDIGKRPFMVDGLAEPPFVLAVCDGMGGREDGEVASALAVETALRFEDKLCAANEQDLYQTVTDCVRVADTSIRDANRRRAGTTLVMAILDRRAVSCFSLGDSRIYVAQRGKVRQVSHDHTWFAEHIHERSDGRGRNGNLYKLTGCLGVGPGRAVAQYPRITGKYRLLLCSDGLTDHVEHEELRDILCEYKDTEDAADELLRCALNNGGTDNVTVIVADGRTSFPLLL